MMNTYNMIHPIKKFLRNRKTNNIHILVVKNTKKWNDNIKFRIMATSRWWKEEKRLERGTQVSNPLIMPSKP